MTAFRFENVAPLELRQMGLAPNAVSVHPVLFLQPALRRELFIGPQWARFLSSGWMRFEGEIQDEPVSLAWQPSVSRGPFVRLCPKFCNALKLVLGELVTLRFNPVEASAPRGSRLKNRRASEARARREAKGLRALSRRRL
jgi:hypothetical protein